MSLRLDAPHDATGGLDPEALVAGRYDTRAFRLTPRARFMFAGGKGMRVRRDTEAMVKVVDQRGRTQAVKVEVDASGKATHIHEDHRLHAVARPDAIRLGLRAGQFPPDVPDTALRRLFYKLATRRS